MAHSRHAGPPGLPRHLVATAIVAAQALLLVGYFSLTEATVTTPRYVLYPFVWINVGLYAVYRVDVPDAPRRHRLLAAAVAGVYFLLLANWSGLYGFTTPGHHGVAASTLGLTIGSGSPGWQTVDYVTRTFYVSVVPFRAIGYLALAYLVYAAVLDLTGAAVSGALGLVSCLSCSFPIVASFATGIWGGSVTLMTTVYNHAIDISTLTFLLSVALLYWRPGFQSLRLAGDAGDDTGEGCGADEE